MNSRTVNLVLLALVLGLLGTIGFMAYLMKTGSVLPDSILGARVVTNTVTQIAVRKVYPTNFLASLGKLPISWRAIESTNYQTYIANLRMIDCPEETIRDIVVTDVAKLYTKRRAAIRAQGPPYRFWLTGEAWENGPARDPAIRKQLQDLEREQRELIKQLLGVNLQAELAKYWSADDEQDRMYGFLPQEKRQRAQEVQAKYDELEQEVYANSKGVLLDQDQEKLRRLQMQRESELAGILSPEELEEYQLRNSPTANAMRAQMGGFQPTEEEFRKIFQLQKTFDNDFNRAFDLSDSGQSEVKARAQQAAQEALNAEVKKTIGETRFNEWVRAQDADYRALAQVANRFELPRETAGRVYDMKLEAEKQKQKIDTNPNLTQEQRNTALAAIANETSKSVASALGDPVFKAYQKANGQWLQDLTVSQAPPELPAPAPTPQPTGPRFYPGLLPPFPPGLPAQEGPPIAYPGLVPPPPKQ